MRYHRIGWIVTVFLGTALARAGEPAGAAGPATQPAVDVLSVQITRPLSPQLARVAGSLVRRTGGTYNERTGGVDVVISVTVPDKRITAIPEDALQIQNIVDDTFADLGKAKRERYYSPASGITEDGHTCVLSINSERAPGVEATRVFVRGSVSLRCASGVKTSPRTPLQVRIGRNLDAGPVPLTIRSMSDAGTGRVLVNFSTSQNQATERIRGMRFFSADGNEISTGSARGQGVAQSWGPGSLSYQLPSDVDQVSVEVDYVESIEVVTVPFELLLDLGVVKVGVPTTQPAPQPAPPGQRGMIPSGAQGAARAATPAPTTRPAAWPPVREAVNWQADRPAVQWPDIRKDIQFPATRPSVQAFAQAVPPKPQRPAAMPSARLEVISLGVSRTPELALQGGWPRPESYFQPEGGTVLKLLLAAGDRPIIKVDTERLWIDRFVDNRVGDRSTDVHPVMTAYGASYAMRRGVLFSSDAKQAVFSIHLKDAPAAGATQLLLRGDIVARVGTPENTVVRKDVNLAVGQTVQAGPLTLTIRNVLASPADHVVNLPGHVFEANAAQLTLGFHSDKGFELIRKIQFYNDVGREIPSQVHRSSIARSSEDGDEDVQGEASFSCTLYGDVRRADIKISYVDRIETVTIPINLTTSLGI